MNRTIFLRKGTKLVKIILNKKNLTLNIAGTLCLLTNIRDYANNVHKYVICCDSINHFFLNCIDKFII